LLQAGHWENKCSGSWRGKKFISSPVIQIGCGTRLASCLVDNQTYVLWSKEARTWSLSLHLESRLKAFELYLYMHMSHKTVRRDKFTLSACRDYENIQQKQQTW